MKNKKQIKISREDRSVKNLDELVNSQYNRSESENVGKKSSKYDPKILEVISQVISRYLNDNNEPPFMLSDEYKWYREWQNKYVKGYEIENGKIVDCWETEWNSNTRWPETIPCSNKGEDFKLYFRYFEEYDGLVEAIDKKIFNDKKKSITAVWKPFNDYVKYSVRLNKNDNDSDFYLYYYPDDSKLKIHIFKNRKNANFIGELIKNVEQILDEYNKNNTYEITKEEDVLGYNYVIKPKK